METWIRVKTKEQLEAVQNAKVPFGHLLLPAALLPEEGSLPLFAEAKIYLQLPDVLRQNKKEQIRSMLKKASFDGIVVKNLDELGLVLEWQKERKGQRPPVVIADAFLYAYNREAIRFYRDRIPDMRFMCSEELTDKEEKELRADASAFLYKIYGYQTVMVTAQCFRKNRAGCARAGQEGSQRMCLRDESGNILYAECDCSLCQTIIYNGVPTSMLDKDVSGYENIFYDFTIEDAATVKKILQVRQCERYTRGHHFLPVE